MVISAAVARVAIMSLNMALDAARAAPGASSLRTAAPLARGWLLGLRSQPLPLSWLANGVTRTSMRCLAGKADGRPRHVKPELPPDFSMTEVTASGCCEGCGVTLQREDPDKPGFFRVPEKLIEEILANRRAAAEGPESMAARIREAQEAEDMEGEGDEEELGELMGADGLDDAGRAGAGGMPWEEGGDEGLISMVVDDPELEARLGGGRRDRGGYVRDEEIMEMLEGERRGVTGAEALALEGNYAGEGVDVVDAFGAMAESWLDGGQGKRPAMRDQDMAGRPKVLCARCFSLINYGRVKSAEAEALLPEFDLRRRVGRKLESLRGRKGVVAVVVDVADFDGSLPRWALQQLLPRDAEGRACTTPGVRLVVLANKVDLLPRYVSADRLEMWVRRRARQGGLPRPDAVVLTSARTGFGIARAVEEMEVLAGDRGQVFVVGAQNAGKSSVINAMAQLQGHPRPRITTAALPGTTLGVIEVDGLLPGKARLFDTPGVPHNYQLSSRLGKEELDLAMPSKTLRPRTYRIGAGRSVSIGGLARLDVMGLSGETLYMTVWASPLLVLHMGVTSKAEEVRERHLCGNLRPPLTRERTDDIGPLVPTDVVVEGTEWLQSTVDVHVAGLGWVGVGIKGRADLRVWAPRGVAITTRDALVPDYSDQFERAGFSENAAQLKYEVAGQPAPGKARAGRDAKRPAKGRAGGARDRAPSSDRDKGTRGGKSHGQGSPQAEGRSNGRTQGQMGA